MTLHEKIEKRAYEIWEFNNALELEPNDAISNWLQAEKEIKKGMEMNYIENYLSRKYGKRCPIRPYETPYLERHKNI